MLTSVMSLYDQLFQINDQVDLKYTSFGTLLLIHDCLCICSYVDLIFDHLLAVPKLRWKMTVKNKFCIFRYDLLPKMFPLIPAVGSHKNQLVAIVTAYHCQHLNRCQRTS